MRILVVGDWHSELHEEPVCHALEEIGHDVLRFPWHQYFRPAAAWPRPARAAQSMALRAQNKYLLGPAFKRMNRELVRAATQGRPDLIFVYRGTHVAARSLTAVRRALPDTVIVGYNNDDPFGPGQPRLLWRHFLRGLPDYDVALAYRQHNLAEFQQHGARSVRLLRSWFVPERNHPVTLSEGDRQRFETDVVFVGHYEADGRLELLESIVRHGHRLRLFGPGYDWDPVLARSKWLREHIPVELVWGEDYNKALCGAKVALCFFSRLNRDTYTRRCFEIPATGTMMLSEHSDDMAQMFASGREADFFRSERELGDKLRLYLSDHSLRARVAAGGLERVWADGHDIVSRLKTLLEWLRDTTRLRAD